MRVIGVVKYNKTCIDRLIAVIACHPRTGMATKSAFRLKQHHTVVFGELMRRRHARNSRTDNCNALARTFTLVK